MTLWHMVALLCGGYLLLLARSAWIQGETRQFLLSLLLVVGLVAVLAGAVGVAIYLDYR